MEQLFHAIRTRHYTMYTTLSPGLEAKESLKGFNWNNVEQCQGLVMGDYDVIKRRSDRDSHSLSWSHLLWDHGNFYLVQL